MSKLRLGVLFGSTLVAAAAHPLGAVVQSSCRTSDPTAQALVIRAKRLLGARDARTTELRTKLGITESDSSAVRLITDTRVCAKLVTGMNTAHATPNRARQLYALSLGRTYLAMDPDTTANAARGTDFFSARSQWTGATIQ
jgi:hypothetical protein